MAAPRNVARVWIGSDPRELDAYSVAVDSLFDHASIPVSVSPLDLRRLELAGLMRRPRTVLKRGRPFVVADGRAERRITTAAAAGTMWDEISAAPMATEFAVSRFLVPVLAQHGFALFIDCDMLFLADVAELFALADDRFAVQCVKHAPLPSTGWKMDGQPQLPYPRKNWSSVVLWNCDHPANRALTVDRINSMTGRDLHRFGWLDDAQIGELPPAWNWLVGVQPLPEAPKLAHYTLGGPWLPGWSPREHDDLWLSAAARFRARA